MTVLWVQLDNRRSRNGIGYANKDVTRNLHFHTQLDPSVRLAGQIAKGLTLVCEASN